MGGDLFTIYLRAFLMVTTLYFLRGTTGALGGNGKGRGELGGRVLGLGGSLLRAGGILGGAIVTISRFIGVIPLFNIKTHAT